MAENQQPDFKQIIKEEYIKCAKDPGHFMRKYCFIQHPTRGRIQFNLYQFQSKVLNLWANNSYNIVLKSRQLGISTLAAGYSLWLMLFHRDKNVLCIATKTDTAKNMVTKVKFMFDNLPAWLKGPKPLEDNKLSLKLHNGSQIKAVSSTGDSSRSEAVSLLVIDEAAFIENAEEIWASSQQTLATGGGAIVLSTPYGTGNFFHKTWIRAESGENTFLPIKLPWFVHPERDQAWRDKQDVELGPKMAAQECDCNFETSGDTVFRSDFIEFYEKTYVKDPVERRGVDKNLWIWEPVDYSKSYMVVADVARGDGKDYSAFHIFDIETNVQVGEYKGQIGTTEFGHLLVGISAEYNNALLVVENANIGWATIQTIIDRGYPNLYHSQKTETLTAESYLAKYDNPNNLVPGFTNSLRTRPMVVSKMEEYVRDKSVTIQSKRTIEEMKTFIWKNGRPEAQNGYNDDLVMSCGIGLYVRDTSLKFKQQNTDLARAALGGIVSTKTNSQGVYSSKHMNNPFNIQIGNQNENLDWLL
jgi:hypothetical protein